MFKSDLEKHAFRILVDDQKDIRRGIQWSSFYRAEAAERDPDRFQTRYLFCYGSLASVDALKAAAALDDEPSILKATLKGRFTYQKSASMSEPALFSSTDWSIAVPTSRPGHAWMISTEEQLNSIRSHLSRSQMSLGWALAKVDEQMDSQGTSGDVLVNIPVYVGKEDVEEGGFDHVPYIAP